MNKTQKTEAIDILKNQVSKFENFYITDASELNVEDINKLRRLCFQRGIKFEVVKNTILRKALESHGDKYEKLLSILHGPTSVMFSESTNEPAKMIKQFRRENDKQKPLMKAAYVGSDVFLGDENLDALINLKSKEQLIGEIISMLQSPAKNVISALQSSANKLSGILETLSNKKEE